MHLANSRNPLLVKDDVGRSKPTCYDLPNDGFAFGRPENADIEGAREVTMQWVQHKPNIREEDRGTNFIAVNKFAAKKNVSLKMARKSVDEGNPSPQKTRTGPPPVIVPSDVIPSFTYGKKTRPSTPISSVISNQYCAEYEAAQDLNYQQIAREKKAVQQAEVHETRASAGHKQGAARRRDEQWEKEYGGQQKDAFKMKKFKNVKAKIHLTDAYAARNAAASSGAQPDED